MRYLKYIITLLFCLGSVSAWQIDLDEIMPSFSWFPQVSSPNQCSTSLDCGISTDCLINECVNAGYRKCQQIIVPAGASCGNSGYCDGNGNCISNGSVVVGDNVLVPGWGLLPQITIQPNPIEISQNSKPPVCADTNECTDDVFNAETRQCQHVPLTGPACGSGSYCALGSCVQSIVCPDSNACTSDVITMYGVDCNFVNQFPQIRQQISCDDGISTTIDSCDPQTGCVHTFSAPVPEFGLIGGIIAIAGGAVVLYRKKFR